MKAAREVGCRRQPARCGRRTGRQRAVAGEGTPDETAGERRRGRSIGADVPTLTGPDFVLTSGAQVAPTCGAVAGGPRRASGARASAAVGAMSFLVLRSRSSRCHRLGVERPPVHATARSDPATLPHKAVAPATAPAGLVPRPPSELWRSWSYEAGPAADTASAWSALPYMPPPATTPQPSPHKAVAPATRSGDLPGQGGRHASKKHS